MPTGVYLRTKEMKKNMNKFRMGHFVSKETRKKISKALTGNPKIVGRRFSPSTEFKKGVSSSPKPFKKGHIPWNKGMKGFMVGSKNAMWKGGITPFLRRLRTCFEYRQWRSDVFTRDDFTCVKCNRRGGRLHGDHIKLFSFILRENNVKTYEEAIDCAELWNTNNGQTLCEDCHNDKTKIDLKRSWGIKVK